MAGEGLGKRRCSQLLMHTLNQVYFRLQQFHMYMLYFCSGGTLFEFSDRCHLQSLTCTSAEEEDHLMQSVTSGVKCPD